jgi:DNA-binding transcriptional LysR family regulator
MDRLQAMNTFVRVVEAGSFSAVAREQRTSQSAISKQIAALERVLGAKLLTRTTRSLSLTDNGERYFSDARRLVAEVAEAESALRQGEQQLTGWLRVAASVGYGRMILMPLVQSFLREHPGVRIDLRLNDGFIDLVEQGVDVAVRIGDLEDSSLLARRIGTAHRGLLASRGYLRGLPRSAKPLRDPGDLARYNCIVYTELAQGGDWTFVAGNGADAPVGSSKTVRAEGSLQTNSSEVVRAAVLAGMGVSYSPTWLFGPEIESGEVQVLLPDWSMRPLPVHLVSPAQRCHVAKVRAFGDFVAAQTPVEPI